METIKQILLEVLDSVPKSSGTLAAEVCYHPNFTEELFALHSKVERCLDELIDEGKIAKIEEQHPFYKNPPRGFKGPPRELTTQTLYYKKKR